MLLIRLVIVCSINKRFICDNLFSISKFIFPLTTLKDKTKKLTQYTRNFLSLRDDNLTILKEVMVRKPI